MSVLLVVGALAVGAAQSDATRQFSVTNESITVNYTSPTPVENADVAVGFNDSVTIYNATGVELAAGTDYTWNAENGTVTWHDSGDTTDGDQAAITYQYDAPSDESRGLGVVLSTGWNVAMFGVLLLGGFTVLNWLGLTPGSS